MKVRQTIKVSYSKDYKHDEIAHTEVELAIDGEDLTPKELESLFSRHIQSRFARADASAWKEFKDKYLLKEAKDEKEESIKKGDYLR